MTEKLYNAQGASKKLGFSVVWIHQLVKNGVLPARAFNAQGELVKHIPDGSRRGQELLFKEEDFAAYRAAPKRKRGRQRGSKVRSTGLLKL